MRLQFIIASTYCYSRAAQTKRPRLQREYGVDGSAAIRRERRGSSSVVGREIVSIHRQTTWSAERSITIRSRHNGAVATFAAPPPGAGVETGSVTAGLYMSVVTDMYSIPGQPHTHPFRCFCPGLFNPFI